MYTLTNTSQVPLMVGSVALKPGVSLTTQGVDDTTRALALSSFITITPQPQPHALADLFVSQACAFALIGGRLVDTSQTHAAIAHLDCDSLVTSFGASSHVTATMYNRVNHETIPDSFGNTRENLCFASRPDTGTEFLTTPGCALEGNTITKTGSSPVWDCAASSLASYADNIVLKVVIGCIGDCAIGLNSDPTSDPTWASLDYAWLLRADGILLVATSGTCVSTQRTYSAGQELVIVYEDDTVKFIHNGELIREITRPRFGQPPLYLDSSFQTPGSQFNGVSFYSSVANPCAVSEQLLPHKPFTGIVNGTLDCWITCNTSLALQVTTQFGSFPLNVTGSGRYCLPITVDGTGFHLSGYVPAGKTLTISQILLSTASYKQRHDTVLCHGDLPSGIFFAQGTTFSYYQGMPNSTLLTCIPYAPPVQGANHALVTEDLEGVLSPTGGLLGVISSGGAVETSATGAWGSLLTTSTGYAYVPATAGNQALATQPGQFVSDRFSLRFSDGSTLALMINVTWDSPVSGWAGNLATIRAQDVYVSGSLISSPAASFVEKNYDGLWGTFTVTAAGQWSYLLNVNNSDMFELSGSEFVVDSVVVENTLGNKGVISVTITA